MKLSKVIEIWGILHKKDTGNIGFCDLERAIEEVDSIENDVNTTVWELPAQQERAMSELLTEKEIETITAEALSDNPHWQPDAWGLFMVVAKAQLAKAHRPDREKKVNETNQ